MKKLLLCSALLFATPALADGPSIYGTWYTGNMSCDFPDFIEVTTEWISIYEMRCTYENIEDLPSGGIATESQCFSEGSSEGKRVFRIEPMPDGRISLTDADGAVTLQRCPQ